jgi:hypothetical protein
MSAPDSSREAQYRQLVFATSVGAVVLCPLIIALPPRKFDIYTVAMIAGAAMGGNQLAREYTGRSIVERMRDMATPTPVPRAGRAPQDMEQKKRVPLEGVPKPFGGRGTASAKETGEGAGDGGRRGVLEAIWVGDERAGWKAERDAREKKALEDGRGYGGLILDQIWEVWNGGREKVEKAKEVDMRATEGGPKRDDR